MSHADDIRRQVVPWRSLSRWQRQVESSQLADAF